MKWLHTQNHNARFKAATALAMSNKKITLAVAKKK